MACDVHEQEVLWRWLSQSEESIYLLDGLFNIKDLLVPGENEIPLSEAAEPLQDEICKLVKTIKVGIEKTGYRAPYSLADYRLQALKGLWKARKAAVHQQGQSGIVPTSGSGTAIGDHDRGSKVEVKSDVTTELTLLLLFPLLESQTRVDAGLRSTLIQSLVQFFQQCPPMSLKRPMAQLDRLEQILIEWVNTPIKDDEVEAVTALVSMACARDSIMSILNVVSVLLESPTKTPLPVQDVLARLIAKTAENDSPQQLDVSRHLRGFHYNSRKVARNPDAGSGCECKDGSRRSIVKSQDDRFFFVTNDSGCRLAKIGTGLGMDSIRGFMYALNDQCQQSGLLVHSKEFLIHRPWNFDTDATNNLKFGIIFNTDTLQPQIELTLPQELQLNRKSKTIHILKTKDDQIIWLRAVSVTAEETQHVQIQFSALVLMDTLEISDDGCSIRSVKARQLLLKQVESEQNAKALLDIVGEIEPAPGAVGHQGPTPTDPAANNPGVDPNIPPNNKDDTNLNGHSLTSSGLKLSSLTENPITTCGQFLSVMVSNPDTRLKGIRNLGTSYSFNLDTCVFQGQIEIYCDSATCPLSLPRGYSIISAAILHDPVTNKYWSLAYNRIDEFNGQDGGQPTWCIRKNLGITATTTTTNGSDQNSKTMSSNDVTTILMEQANISSLKGQELIGSEDLIKQICKVGNKVAGSNSSMMMSAVTLMETIIDVTPPEAVKASRSSLEKLIMDQITGTGSMSNSSILKEKSFKLLFKMEKMCGCGDNSDNAPIGLNSKLIQSSPEKYQPMLKQFILEASLNGLTAFHPQLFDVAMGLIDELAFNARSTLLRPGPESSLHSTTKMLIKYASFIHEAAILDTDQLDMTKFEAYAATATNACLSLIEVVQAFIKECEQGSQYVEDLKRLHRILQASPLTHPFIGPFLSTCHHLMQHDRLSSMNILQMIDLFVKLCDLRGVIQQQQQSRDNNSTTNPDMVNDIVLPWVFARQVETPHPIREGFKLQETIRMPGAKCLLLIFDPKCSTTTEFDRLCVYAGQNVSGKKVIDCSGNSTMPTSPSSSSGPGNPPTRRLGGPSLPKGWPQAPVFVVGDSITLDFEVKGKQDTSPNSSLPWGFRIAVGHCPNDVIYQRKSDYSQWGTIDNMLLGLLPILSHYVQTEFEGSKVILEEEKCRTLLKSHFLQKCSWSEEQVSGLLPMLGDKAGSEVLPSIPCLPPAIVQKLRRLTGLTLPLMRESIKQVLQPTHLEESIVAVIAKHMDLHENIKGYEENEDPMSPDGFLLNDILSDAYLKISSLLRKLQSLAELEGKWNDEVSAVREGLIGAKEAFFADYLHHEHKTKELELLCFLKSVKGPLLKPQTMLQELKDKLEKEATTTTTSSREESSQDLKITKSIVNGLFSRLDLLLRADVGDHSDKTMSRSTSQMMTTSLQGWPDGSSARTMKRQQSHDIDRILDDSILQIPKLLSRCGTKMAPPSRSATVLESSLSVTSGTDWNVDQETVLDDLFAFIGSSPEDSVSGTEFLRAMLARIQRCGMRSNALKTIKVLMAASLSSPWMTSHTLSLATTTLMIGLRKEDLYCSKEVTRAIEAEYLELMQMTITIITKDCAKYHPSIGHLCITPFAKDEDKIIAESGLLLLLNSLSNHHPSVALSSQPVDGGDSRAGLSQLAWHGFKLIALRFLTTEEEGPADTKAKSGNVEKQIASLLTNYLMQAAGQEHKGDSLQALKDALFLLHDLSKSKIGKGILSQAGCASKLLMLLGHEGMSPQMVCITIRLLQVALPLMSQEECCQIEVSRDIKLDPEENTIYLIILKLAEFVSMSSGDCHTTTTCSPLEFAPDQEVASLDTQESLDHDETSNPTQALYVHKRSDQNAHELIQQLLNASGDIGLFPSMGSDSMEKVIRIDKEMNQKHMAEVLQGDATRIFRAASKMAQLGFVVSISAPSQCQESSSGRRLQSIQLCAERNDVHAKNAYSSRPYISSTVANRLAAEIISLLHTLAKTANSTKWSLALEKIMLTTLSGMDHFFEAVSNIANLNDEDLVKSIRKSEELIACLSIVGGFYETVKPGSQVEPVGSSSKGSIPTDCVSNVKAVNMKKATCTLTAATKQCLDGIDLDVPYNEVKISDNLQTHEAHGLGRVAAKLVPSLQSILLPTKTGTEALVTPLPVSSPDQRVLKLSRLAAEVRTRACQVLAINLDDQAFACSFLKESCQAVDMLKYYAKDCLPSDSRCCTAFLCEHLRNTAKESSKPSRSLKPLIDTTATRSNHWNTSSVYPAIKSVVFTHKLLGIAYHGTPITSIGIPRGVIVTSTLPLSLCQDGDSFEIDVLSLGEGRDESGAPAISIGLTPQAEKKDGAWSHPEGALYFHSNGRLVHYKGPSLLTWKSTRVEHLISPGDKVKMKWTPAASVEGTILGNVEITVNGNEITDIVTGVCANLYPAVHVQQKGARVRGYFDNDTMVEADGKEKMTASRQNSTVTDGNSSRDLGAGHRRVQPHGSRPAIKARPERIYNPSNVIDQYRLPLDGYPLFLTGLSPLYKTHTEELIEDEEDEEEFEEASEDAGEDINALLVKSWEAKVFPAIRRRFRNESERRDGLEQIKGALALGMIDIAKQTVEFLYEENGGLPPDMKLPDLDDIKQELSKLSIHRLRPKNMVHITTFNQLPPFACKQQMKTFGLDGEVVAIDVPNELIEVESYVETDGVLMRFWYPIDALEKCNSTSKGKKADQKRVLSELLNTEFILSRLMCRRSYLTLVELARHMDITTISPAMEDPDKINTLTSNILLLQDWDIENATYLLDETISSCHQALVPQSRQVYNPQEVLAAHSPSLIDQIIGNRAPGLKDTMIKMMVSEGGGTPVSDILEELLDPIRSEYPSHYSEDIDINEISMLASTLSFANSTFILSNVVFEKTMKANHPDNLKIILVPLNTPTKFFKNQHSPQVICEYPFPCKAGGKHMNIRSFPPLLTTSGCLRVCHSGAGESRTVLRMEGIPNKIVLALVTIDALLENDGAPTNKKICSQILDMLSHFVFSFSLQPQLKVTCFSLIVKGLKRLRSLLSSSEEPVLIPKALRHVTDSLAREFIMHYESETKASGGLSLYSSYTTSLFELLVNIFNEETCATDMPKGLHLLIDMLRIFQNTVQGKPPSREDLKSLQPTKDLTDQSRKYFVLLNLPKRLDKEAVSLTVRKTFISENGGNVEDVHLAPPAPVQGNHEGTSNGGWAVVRAQLGCKSKDIKTALQRIEFFNKHTEQDIDAELGTIAPYIVSTVNLQLHCAESSCDGVWTQYLQSLLMEKNTTASQLSPKAKEVMESLFKSGCRDPNKKILKFSDLLLKKNNPALAFLNGSKERPSSDIQDDLKLFFQSTKDSNTPLDAGDEMDLDDFDCQILAMVQNNVRSVFRGLFSAGYGIDLQPLASLEHCQANFQDWSLQEDKALVSYINNQARVLNISTRDFKHDDFSKALDGVSLTNQLDITKSEEDIRSRLLLWHQLNTHLAERVVPLVNFNSNHGVSRLVRDHQDLLFSSWKTKMFDDILNTTVLSDPDTSPVIVTFNPMDTLDRKEELACTWFFQTFNELKYHSSASLCTALPSSDDPKFPLQVKMTGEEVQGNSGSFRHFLIKVVNELHSNAVPLLMPYMGNGTLKGLYLLRPGPLNILDEKLLVHLGQLLGIAIRSGVPLPLNLVPTFWKSLLGHHITDEDRKTFDANLERLLIDLEVVEDESTFDTFLEEHQLLTFTGLSLTGDEVELVDKGKAVPITFHNRRQYIDAVKNHRVKELQSQERINCILCGLATIIPIGFVRGLLTPEEFELRVCGSGEVDLGQLKKNTLYQVGLSEDDRHIQNFWTVLHSLNHKQLRLFVKFACNQERIPKITEGAGLPPPYPMKVAPADARDGVQDSLLIRAETCIFMLKIPRYSTYEVMREKLLYSIHAADDPLIG